MIELNGMLEPILKDLRQTISSINGAKSIEENLSITYLVEVQEESEKEPVEKVGAVLSAQAEKYGLFIEVVPVTTGEIEESKKRMEEYLSSQTKFKA